MGHWRHDLVRRFSSGKPSTVELDVDPNADHSGVLVVAARIRGIYDAVKGGPGTLREESTEDLLRLAGHLQRLVRSLTAFQDWVIIELRRREVSTRAIGAAMETNHMAVARREKRILRASGDDRPEAGAGSDPS